MNTTRLTRRSLLLILFATVALSASATVFTTNTEIGPLNTTYDGQDIGISNCTVTVDGPHTFASLTVATNGILTHSFSTNGQLSVVVNDTNEVFAVGLDLAITGVVWVANGGEIDADGVGYGGSFGPGAGGSSTNEFFDGSGGGDGGSGGMSSGHAVGGVCYDSLYQPGLPGSGGGASYAGSGGNGGGLIQIMAGGNVEIDGIITANGQSATNSRAGGGSGGGIWISAPSVSGAGSLTANGGAGAPGYGGGGGGGRIAIVCSGANNFAGTITAYGGGGANNGGAGTEFTESSELPGLLTLNNGGNMGANSMVTLSNLADVTISSGATVVASTLFSPRNVTIGTNGILTGLQQTSLQFSASNLTVQAGGALSVNGLGYSTGGPGWGGTYSSGGVAYGGGGGYGGFGGAAAITNANGGNAININQLFPTQIGSSGGGNAGGAGGGALNITVTGTLQVNGVISANGFNGIAVANSYPGGGSGGSVKLAASNLSGTGTITANGGNGASSLGGGGGGGAIGIQIGSDNFSGTMTAYGGGGANYGGSGTVYLAPINSTAQLILDNGGNSGPPTPLPTSISTANLTVQNGAWATLPGGLTCANLLVASNSWLTISPNNFAIGFIVLTNATFAAGGGFTLNSDGYPANQGFDGAPGYSVSAPFSAAGGGNGGTGGNGAGFIGFSPGSEAGYNQISSPNYAGSGGGGYVPNSTGGNGGGAVNLIVGGTLQVNGVISANGGNGSGAGGGGGAGGSLSLSAGTLSGTGSIIADGGNGVGSVGGGGGGGCIALAFKSDSFSGTLAAFGGAGANDGGAGTIYSRSNSLSSGQLVLDNGGQNGGSSVFTSSQLPSGSGLTVRNGSTLDFNSTVTLSLGNLLITNASIMTSNNSTLTIIANNVSLQNGGRIVANAGGYQQNVGPDAGRTYQSLPYPGSGGGNGGCGGMAISNEVAGGGGGFQNFNQASEPGSGGGGENPYSIGGPGGGVIDLEVFGTLSVNGMLSANGGNGGGSGGGGGAGGSLNLTIGSLTGSGVISANGGNGVGNIGGGGGGGMISCEFLYNSFSNLFTGTLSAYGGGGATNGGAGTIFIDTNFTGQATLFVDNGGNLSTNTPIPFPNSSSVYSIVVRNGAIASFPSDDLTFSSVLIGSNGWMVPGNPGGSGEVYLSVSGNATIQAGGGITADSSGYTQGNGPGRGLNYFAEPLYPCSGAGHGGYGALGTSNLVVGGGTYDTIGNPNQPGSGGGGFLPYSTGGNGGGYVNLDLTSGGALQVNGLISANGGNGSGSGGGGGSGGAIHLFAGTITGTGSIRANGGAGALYGGGGGGGCIELNSTLELRTNAFLGTVSAYGGGGANYGGAGTLYYVTNNSPIGLSGPVLYVDNANNVGTDTTLNVSSAYVTIQNGAIGMIPNSIWQMTSVTVLTNSELTSLVGQTTVRATSMNIATGGVFSVDGCGYAAQNGAGAGSAAGGISGGGGHGGYGGGNFSGGAAYDSIIEPTAEGSGGASSSAGSGGAGGGALTVVVNTFILNGRISANGRAGGLNAGGGAGGSIYIPGLLLNTSGNGIISANGGAGSGSGGGGAGGRIYGPSTASKNLTGQYQYIAMGGGGTYPGGAGTILTGTGTSGGQTLVINNGGLTGTNTPLSSAFSLPTPPFELDISGGASVVPLTPLPLLSNLNVLAESTLTMPVPQSGLSVGVIGNANIVGDMDVDDLGYSQTNGPGAGVAVDSEGSGAGYGGTGGASDSGAAGGVTYGSATAPTAFGSGGGNGADTTSGGSSGGGALRLSVLGTLNVSGNISANGDSGLQDDSGGGSGGSVWITAGTLSGAGTISAAGGDGVFYGGGGGGGGRIAIYAPTNQFTGTTNVTGGAGTVPGQPGTISLSSALNGLQILSQSPYGLVSNTVSSVNLTFSDMLNPASISSGDFTLYTPTSGTLVPGPTFTVINPFTVQLNFPTQNIEGPYTVQVQGSISDMAGNSLTQSYTGVFIISIPTISGTVTGTNGVGVAGVSMQASGGLSASFTDSNGNYSLGVPPGWTGTVTPSFGSYLFVPPSMSYTNISGSLTNQNYSMVQTISPTLGASVSASNFSLNWNGISGVSYQVLWSTNLVSWQPLGSPLAGTNGPMQVVLPSGSNSAEFFQIQAGD